MANSEIKSQYHPDLNIEQNIAIVSPSKDIISETFVKAHVEGLSGNVFHYYDGHLPRSLAGKGSLVKHDLVSRLKRKVRKEGQFNLEEQAFMDSLLDHNIDVVLAEYGPTGAQVLPICLETEIPLIVHFHGYDASQYDIIEKYKDSYKELFSKAFATVVVSSKMREMILEIGGVPEKLHILPYGPDPTFFDIVLTPNVIPHFLSVGRFVDKKAPYYVLLAFKELIDSGMDARLTMAGSGPLYASVKNLVNHFGMNDKVALPGVVDHRQVKELMSKADCYVQHSIRALSGDMEGTPVSIIEAAAAGLQVISTYHAGIPDVIIHEETGFLVEEHDVHSMADYMQRSARSAEERERMGSASRSRIAAQFSREENLRQLNELVKNAING